MILDRFLKIAHIWERAPFEKIEKTMIPAEVAVEMLSILFWNESILSSIPNIRGGTVAWAFELASM